MAAQKTVIEVVLDVGPSLRGDSIDLARYFVGHFLFQRLMASKTMEFGLVTFGGDLACNAPYVDEHSLVKELIPVQKPNLGTFDIIDQLSCGNAPGSLVDGLSAGFSVLETAGLGKTCNRCMLLVTDGEARVERVDGLDDTISRMVNLANFRLCIVLLDCTSSASPRIKSENKKWLQRIADHTSGRLFEVACLAEGLHALFAEPGFSTKPALIRTHLELTQQLKIPCLFWTKISEAAPPSLKKRARFALPGDTDMVKRILSYRNPSDPDREVPLEARVKGYRYGAQHTPLGQTEEELLQLGFSASISVMGAIPQSCIRRQHFLEPSMYLHGSSDSREATLCIVALREALEKKSLALVAKLVRRDNTDPFMVALTPSPRDGPESLLMHRLPCADDMRAFWFPSLDNFTRGSIDPLIQNARGTMEAFIDSFTIAEPSPALLRPPNPSLHAILDELCIRSRRAARVEPKYRCVFPSVECLPPNAADAVSQLYSTFQLCKQDKAKSGDRSSLHLDCEEATTPNTILAAEGQVLAAAYDTTADAGVDGPPLSMDTARGWDGSGDESNGGGRGNGTAPWPLPELSAGSLTPCEDFDALLTAIRDAAALDDVERSRARLHALEAMAKVVDRSIFIGASLSSYKRAITCLFALRSASVLHNMPGVFNTYLTDTLKDRCREGKYAVVLDLAAEAKLSLISRLEASNSQVSPDQQGAFWNRGVRIAEPIAIKAAVAAEEEEALDVDGLFDSMV